VEAYTAAVDGLPWADRLHFDKQLHELGYVITGFAKGPEGNSVPVAIPAILEIGLGLPIELIRKSSISSDSKTRTVRRLFDVRFDTETLPDDEIWEFSSSADSWQNFAGRAEQALVRNGVVIELGIAIMN